MAAPIQFHVADIAFTLKKKGQHRVWINAVCAHHHGNIMQITFVFCSDNYLLQINQQFLQHDYFTDIITFDNSKGKAVDIEAYLSLDRIKENARLIGVSTDQELRRVMIHGVLHALGFKDKNKAEQKKMRYAENEALQLFK
jgi:probable rRNA maturation factor